MVLIFSGLLLKTFGPGHRAELGVHWWGQRCCVFLGMCLGNRACARLRKRSAWKRCWWARSRPLLFMSQWKKRWHVSSACVFVWLSCVRIDFPPYFVGLWQRQVFVNQKKAVDVLSKWPPKDRGTYGHRTSRNPIQLMYTSQVLRQQRLSRLLNPRRKEPGQCQRPEAWANSDALRLGGAGAARMGNELLQGGQARRIQTSEMRNSKTRFYETRTCVHVHEQNTWQNMHIIADVLYVLYKFIKLSTRIEFDNTMIILPPYM